MVVILKRTLDTAIPEGDLKLLIWLCVGLFALRILHTVATYWLRVLNIRITEGTLLALRSDLVAHLYRVSRGYFSLHDEGSLHTLLVQDSARAKRLAHALVEELIPGLLGAALLGMLLVYLNPLLAFVLFALGPPMFFITRMVAARAERKVLAFHRAFERYAHGLLFVIRSMDLTQSTGQESRQLLKQKEQLETMRSRESEMAFTYAAHGQFQSIAVTVSAVTILMIGGAAVIRGAMTLGEFFAFYFVASILNQTVMALLAALPEIVDGSQSLADLYAFLEEAELRPYQGRDSIDFQGGLRCENVSFGYGNSVLLREVSLSIKPGARIVICGDNGAGKTTLLFLLLGLYRPSRGRLLADETPFERLALASLRQRIGTVLQGPGLFSGTARENVCFASPDASDADIETACRAAGAHVFIKELPHGYDSQVGDNAARLSGGQRQKIAMARALLPEPRLLLLDEPTTYLDEAGVEQLLETLAGLPASTAVVTVTHDPALIDAATEVYEIREGQLRRRSITIPNQPKPPVQAEATTPA